jgi:ABC-type Na+ efflux pump permease subunit
VRSSLFRDPLLVKELLGAARRGQMYWARAIYVGVTGLLVFQFWSTMTSRLGSLSPSAYAELSRGLFYTFVHFQMVMVSLAAIGSAAERVIREDRHKTLGLLLLTPLTARQIVFGKWRASVVQSASLIFCGLPVVAICVYLGGVGWEELLWSFSLTLAMAALGAAFGLRASAIHASVPRAVVMAFLYSIGYVLLPIPLMIVTLGFAFIISPFVHPLYSSAVLASRAGLSSVFGYSWVVSTLVSFLVSWLVVRGVAVRVRARVIAPPPTPPNFVYEQKNLLGKLRVPLKVGDRPSRSYREVWESDPLLWKELITHASSRWSRENLIGYGIGVMLFISLFWSFSKGESQGTLAFLGMFFMLLAVANGASLFAPDKEGRRMEMLLSSPVRSSAIVASKLLSGVLAPVAVRVTLLALATVVAFSYWSGVAGVLIHSAVFFGFLTFVFLLASTASLHAVSSQGASLATLGVLGMILIVVPIAVAIAVPSGGEGLTGPWALLSALNPMWVIGPIRRANDLNLQDAAGRCFLFVLIYGGVAAGLVGWIQWRFDRVMGRS